MEEVRERIEQNRENTKFLEDYAYEQIIHRIDKAKEATDKDTIRNEILQIIDML